MARWLTRCLSGKTETTPSFPAGESVALHFLHSLRFPPCDTLHNWLVVLLIAANLAACVQIIGQGFCQRRQRLVKITLRGGRTQRLLGLWLECDLCRGLWLLTRSEHSRCA